MSQTAAKQVAIVDYGMGNLFSVLNACEAAGLNATITSSRAAIAAAPAVILPGVGAFGDAMNALKKLDLVDTIHTVAASGKPLFGICLGMQLMLTCSDEFGSHEGLNLFPGKVVRFETPTDETGRRLKVPEVQWNRIIRPAGSPHAWDNTLLDTLNDGEYMYFVHSFYCVPDSSQHVVSTSKYGNIEYCSSLRNGNVFACQFHPERSGQAGMVFYRNLAQHI